jgi:hypothetical protein
MEPVQYVSPKNLNIKFNLKNQTYIKQINLEINAAAAPAPEISTAPQNKLKIKDILKNTIKIK